MNRREQELAQGENMVSINNQISTEVIGRKFSVVKRKMEDMELTIGKCKTISESEKDIGN